MEGWTDVGVDGRDGWVEDDWMREGWMWVWMGSMDGWRMDG